MYNYDFYYYSISRGESPTTLQLSGYVLILFFIECLLRLLLISQATPTSAQDLWRESGDGLKER